MTTENRVDAITEIRARIDHALHIRRATKGTAIAKVENATKTAGGKLWDGLKRRPSLGVAALAGAGLGLAMIVGVGELTVAIAAAAFAYQVLREGVPPRAAAKNIIEEMEKL